MPNSHIIEDGISGEKAKDMVNRIPVVIYKHHPKLMIILGGTNDLAARFTAEQITKHIVKLHEYVLRNNRTEIKQAYTVAMTIPQLPVEKHEFNLVRIEVNKGIREFVSRCKNRVAFLDIADLFDQKNISNMVFWSPDKGICIGLHFFNIFQF